MATPSFVVEDQGEVIAFLVRTLRAEHRIDTHGAVVLLSGERAYKLKRAVKFPYMDFSTLQRRADFCRAEVAINRKLAPSLYLGVMAVCRAADGTLSLSELDAHSNAHPEDAIDWLVVMRRFDEDGLLDRMAARGALTPELMTSLGAQIAAFHDGAPPISGFSGPEDYRRSVAADIREMRARGAGLIPELSEALAEAMPAALEPHMALVARRAGAGAVRHCHGDMHLRNIVLLDRKPVPFDAIEFSERIASIDVLYDLAFALMDLVHRGLQPLANRLLNEWLWRIEEIPGATHDEALALLPLFLARRAAIRAFVDAAAARVKGKVDEDRLGEGARAYQRTAFAAIQSSAPRLLAIGGLSGSGKTTLALKLAPGIGRVPGAVVMRSDVERKRQAGVALEDRMPGGSYTPEASARVYAACLARAERVLKAGHSAIFDAVCAKPEERAAVEALAARLGVPFEAIWLDVPKDVALARIAARRSDASDATPAVVERQFGYELGEIRWKRRSSF